MTAVMGRKGTLLRRGAAALGVGFVALLLNVAPAAAHYNGKAPWSAPYDTTAPPAGAPSG